jgi:hypothetical protein
VSGALFVTDDGELTAVDGAQFTGACRELVADEVAAHHAAFYDALLPDATSRAKYTLPVAALLPPADHRIYQVTVERLWLVDTTTWIEDRIDRRVEVPRPASLTASGRLVGALHLVREPLSDGSRGRTRPRRASRPVTAGARSTRRGWAGGRTGSTAATGAAGPSGFTTRCTVEAHRPPVQNAIRSPMFTTKLSATVGTASQSVAPSGSTSRPPRSSSTYSTVKLPQSVCRSPAQPPRVGGRVVVVGDHERHVPVELVVEVPLRQVEGDREQPHDVPGQRGHGVEVLVPDRAEPSSGHMLAAFHVAG